MGFLADLEAFGSRRLTKALGYYRHISERAMTLQFWQAYASQNILQQARVGP